MCRNIIWLIALGEPTRITKLAALLLVKIDYKIGIRTVDELVMEIWKSSYLEKQEKRDYEQISKKLIEICSREERLVLFLLVYLSRMLPDVDMKILFEKVKLVLKKHVNREEKVDKEGKRYDPEQLTAELERLLTELEPWNNRKFSPLQKRGNSLSRTSKARA